MVFEKVVDGLGLQKDRLRLSLKSLVADPLASVERFNNHFSLVEPEKEAVAWGYTSA
jgi:hypothetical protein